ncbi:helix-turn-helix domain-containing protein [Maritalea porphyrae]|jgi:transcriptional regulator with XRE-family HTH domain|uniref:helix-turn-helix domain-containing protein n=1 Tax=Maritalea porphyrae TaxID=880732 RepID=UPI0022AF18E1|nr:helix-turn-helix domain-containing protein [Maritalea porphyrae]MCZ4270924.1 helix-turn-helix domain-containing protein [Maritalea porphyrae]
METAIKHIRTRVFKVSQAEFAALIGRTQPTVSRWEQGVALSLTDMKAIRDAAKAKRVRFADKLFFETPKERA